MKNAKIFGIGSAGSQIVNKLPFPLPRAVLDTCLPVIQLMECEKYLCGKLTTRHMGCGGSIGRGYASAVETLADKLSLFDNKVNIFVCGLGGGTSGMIEYILEHKKQLPHNKYNILVCTYPLGKERNRVNSAEYLMRRLSMYADLVVIIKLDEIRIKMKHSEKNVHLIFSDVPTQMNYYLGLLIRNDETSLRQYLKRHKKHNIVKFMIMGCKLRNPY